MIANSIVKQSGNCGIQKNDVIACFNLFYCFTELRCIKIKEVTIYEKNISILLHCDER